MSTTEALHPTVGIGVVQAHIFSGPGDAVATGQQPDQTAAAEVCPGRLLGPQQVLQLDQLIRRQLAEFVGAVHAAMMRQPPAPRQAQV
jgi:hypothetical protein